MAILVFFRGKIQFISESEKAISYAWKKPS